ncbi:hypothetical protein BIW11_01560 [Tropilaelaps mercedesae]|uniref:Ras-associated and pleckstrin homology domains-containing protein 1-like n=1 Tax=Tropilaelaps mercedesae TaxID=418985 RepID=A0A1V9XC42_9ACAR|nr:hypothetical protein BIW11_01560 [Tropilaelaps mercedesae]
MANDDDVIPTSRHDDPTGDLKQFHSTESQDNELDAILGELCALGSQFERELDGLRAATEESPTPVGLMGAGAPADKNGVVGPGAPGTVVHTTGGGNGNKEVSRTTTTTTTAIATGGNAAQNVRPGPESVSAIAGVRGDGRTDSPDNDSAFSDSISMLSGESSASSGARTSSSQESGKRTGGSQPIGTLSINDDLATAACLHDVQRSQAEQAAQLKAEKIKMALQKLKEASIRKLFIKVFCSDGSAKSLLVDETMSVAYLTKLLAEKSHVTMDPKWALVETIPELYMERIYEEHENLVENLLLWTRDSSNRILFEERPLKYDVFAQPEKYLADSGTQTQLDFDEDQRTGLIEEFFLSPGTSGVSVPEVEGQLYLKAEGKKHWKKHFFVLRASGLYYCPKGKSKLPKDLVCLTTFEMNCVYYGVGWRKKYKAPSEFCFAMKHPQIQSKSCKNIKYLCADDLPTLNKWVTGIRIAKYGRQIKDNYDAIQRDIVEADLEKLAYHRSFSVSSMAKQLAVSPDSSNSSSGSPTDQTTQQQQQQQQHPPNHRLRHSASTGSDSTLLAEAISETPSSARSAGNGRTNETAAPSPATATAQPATNGSTTLRRRDSIASSSGGSSSIGSMSSDRSSVASDPAVAFDLDFPGGTIKRKPNLTQPRLPLTNTTRSLVKDTGSASAVSGVGSSLDDSVSIVSGSSFGSGGSLGRTAGLRFSLRRSHTDEQMTATLARLKQRQALNVSSPTAPGGCPIGVVVKGGPLTPTKAVQLLPMPPVDASSLEDISEASQATPKASPQHAPVAPLTAKNLEKLAQDLAAQCRTDFKVAPIPEKPPSVIYAEPDTAKQSTPAKNVQSTASDTTSSHYQGSPSCSNGSDQATPTNERMPPYWLARSSPITQNGSPSASPSRAKPAPPRRSETTRLSSPNKPHTVEFEQCELFIDAEFNPSPMISPPDAFLRDLHRVMDKKWKVAQTLNMMQDHTPHEILGFRDPRLLSEDERKVPPLRGILLSDASSSSATAPSAPRVPKQVRLDLPGLVCSSPKAKPAPPKRSDSTQLSCTLQSPASPMGQQRLGIY